MTRKKKPNTDKAKAKAVELVKAGMSIREAAKKVKLSPSTVSSHLKKVREEEARATAAPDSEPPTEAKRGPGRPKSITQDQLDAGVEAYALLGSVEEAAEEVGISGRSLYRELSRLGALDEAGEDGADGDDDFDLGDGDPLGEDFSSIDGARKAVRRAFGHLRATKTGHRGHPSALKSLLEALTRLRKWEREDAARETPEERERRLRVEEGEVVDDIIRTVANYEDEAREEKKCLWCGQALSEELAKELHGE